MRRRKACPYKVFQRHFAVMVPSCSSQVLIIVDDSNIKEMCYQHSDPSLTALCNSSASKMFLIKTLVALLQLGPTFASALPVAEANAGGYDGLPGFFQGHDLSSLGIMEQGVPYITILLSITKLVPQKTF